MSRDAEFTASSFANSARAAVAEAGGYIDSDGEAGSGEVFDFDPAAALSMGTAFGTGAPHSNDGASHGAAIMDEADVYRSIGGAPPAAVVHGGAGGGYGGGGTYTPSAHGHMHEHATDAGRSKRPSQPLRPTLAQASAKRSGTHGGATAFAAELVEAAGSAHSTPAAAASGAPVSRHHQVIPTAFALEAAAAAATSAAATSGTSRVYGGGPADAALPPLLPDKYEPALSRYLSLARPTAEAATHAPPAVANALQRCTHTALRQRGSALVTPVAQHGAGSAQGWHWRVSTLPGAQPAGQFSARVFTRPSSGTGAGGTGGDGDSTGGGWLLELHLLAGGHRWFRATAMAVREAWAASVSRQSWAASVTHGAAPTSVAQRRDVRVADIDAASEDVDMLQDAVGAGASDGRVEAAFASVSLSGSAGGGDGQLPVSAVTSTHSGGADGVSDLDTASALHTRLVTLARDGGFDVRCDAIGTMTRMVLRSEDALVRLVREGAAQVWAACVTKYAGSPPSAATPTDARMVAACVACLAATLDVGRLPRESGPIAASVLPTTAVQHAMASLVRLAQTPHSDAATGALRHHCVVLVARLLSLQDTRGAAQRHGAVTALKHVLEEYTVATSTHSSAATVGEIAATATGGLLASMAAAAAPALGVRVAVPQAPSNARSAGGVLAQEL